jgi:hypothetical protein
VEARQALVDDVRRAERGLGLAGLLAIAAMPVVGMWRRRRRVGTERPDEDRAEGIRRRPEGSGRRPR